MKAIGKPGRRGGLGKCSSQHMMRVEGDKLKKPRISFQNKVLISKIIGRQVFQHSHMQLNGWLGCSSLFHTQPTI